MRALDLDLLELLVLDEQVLALGVFVAAADVFLSTGWPLSGSTISCLSRLPVFALMRLNETRSELDDAG